MQHPLSVVGRMAEVLMGRRGSVVWRMLVFAASASIMASCATHHDERDTADLEYDAWRRTRPDRYRFTYRMMAFTPVAGIRFEAHVEGDALRGVVPLDALPPELVQTVKHYTVDDLFKEVRHAYDVGAFHVEVSFDSTYHYPKSLDVDLNERVADDEWSIEILDFAVER